MTKPKKEIVKMCTAKKAFFSTQIASRAASRIRKSGGPLMRWYECPHCHKWHFTSKTEQEYREKRNGLGTAT